MRPQNLLPLRSQRGRLQLSRMALAASAAPTALGATMPESAFVRCNEIRDPIQSAAPGGSWYAPSCRIAGDLATPVDVGSSRRSHHLGGDLVPRQSTARSLGVESGIQDGRVGPSGARSDRRQAQRGQCIRRSTTLRSSRHWKTSATTRVIAIKAKTTTTRKSPTASTPPVCTCSPGDGSADAVRFLGGIPTSSSQAPGRRPVTDQAQRPSGTPPGSSRCPPDAARTQPAPRSLTWGRIDQVLLLCVGQTPRPKLLQDVVQDANQLTEQVAQNAAAR